MKSRVRYEYRVLSASPTGKPVPTWATDVYIYRDVWGPFTSTTAREYVGRAVGASPVGTRLAIERRRHAVGGLSSWMPYRRFRVAVGGVLRTDR